MTGGRAKRLALPALCVLGFLLFGALGIWQLERRVWKLDLIERVEQRAKSPARDLPPPADWASLDPAAWEYRRVTVTGTLLHEKETLVDALTERGPGWWVITPLRTEGGTILVNRGFVPPVRAEPVTRPAGQVMGLVRIEGLVRLSEPRGRVLRLNRPEQNRFYSRDVAAIARARGLSGVAPFFIDAGANPNPGGLPIGGMTVVQFRNAHLVYALTWFGLAALCLAGLALTIRDARGLVIWCFPQPQRERNRGPDSRS